MTTAIPAVNPSMTGAGMKRTARPTPANANTTSTMPAISPTARTPDPPYS